MGREDVVDLGATEAEVQARLARIRRRARDGTYYGDMGAWDLRWLLTAYDALAKLVPEIRHDNERLRERERAQAARLAAVEQALLDWQDHLSRVHRIACDYPLRSVRGAQGEIDGAAGAGEARDGA